VLRYVGVPAIGIGDSNLRHVQLIFPFGEISHAPGLESLVWSPDGKQLAFAVNNAVNNRSWDHQLPRSGRAIYLLNADGTGLRRVTPWKVAAGGIGELAWSPDGSRILFRSIKLANKEPNLSTGNIYLIRPNGKGLRQLTYFGPGTGIQLGSYSPDGRKIVFSTTRGAIRNPPVTWPDLFTMNADGSRIHRLVGTRNWEGTADWGR
jgi:TolB protein